MRCIDVDRCGKAMQGWSAADCIEAKSLPHRRRRFQGKERIHKRSGGASRPPSGKVSQKSFRKMVFTNIDF